MKGNYIAGNWKMNLNRSEATLLAGEILAKISNKQNKYMLAPSFTLLEDVGKVIKGSPILLGAQNMSLDEKGAYTGDVSPLQLLDVGVQVVILGHSERRHIFFETDEMINKKVHLALKHGLEVVLCVGEKLSAREAGTAEAVCKEQITKGLAGVSQSDLAKITIAYEPVWAIGTGKNASPEDADAIHSSIRKTLAALYGEKAAKEMIIQYGGSMKPENAAGLLKKPNIDGGLIGGAGLKTETFLPIALFSE